MADKPKEVTFEDFRIHKANKIFNRVRQRVFQKYFDEKKGEYQKTGKKWKKSTEKKLRKEYAQTEEYRNIIKKERETDPQYLAALSITLNEDNEAEFLAYKEKETKERKKQYKRQLQAEKELAIKREAEQIREVFLRVIDEFECDRIEIAQTVSDKIETILSTDDCFMVPDYDYYDDWDHRSHMMRGVETKEDYLEAIDWMTPEGLICKILEEDYDNPIYSEWMLHLSEFLKAKEKIFFEETGCEVGTERFNRAIEEDEVEWFSDNDEKSMVIGIKNALKMSF